MDNINKTFKVTTIFNSEYLINIHDNKVILNNGVNEKIYSFDEFVKIYCLINLKDYFSVIKHISGLNIKNNSKELLFYKSLNNKRIKKENFLLSKTKLYKKELNINKYGLFISYKYYKRAKRTDNYKEENHQKLHEFYFYGPRVYGLPSEIRLKLKMNINNSLNENQKLNKNDGFLIFDYNKIKNLKYFRKIKNTEYFLKLNKEDGSISYGSWNNDRYGSGGENRISVESFYYKTYFPSEEINLFRKNFNEITTVLNNSVINQPLSLIRQ